MRKWMSAAVQCFLDKKRKWEQKLWKPKKNLRVESLLKIYWIKKSLTKHALGVMNVKYLIEKLFLSWQHLFSIYFFDESQSDYVLAGGRNRSSVESSNWEWQAEIFHGRRKTHTQFSLIFKKKWDETLEIK